MSGPAPAQVVADLVAALGAGAYRPDTGERVTISYGGVTATGTVATMAYHWSTIKGRDIVPVTLDGTGQTVEIHTDHLAPERQVA